MPAEGVRLQKVLAAAGLGSRRACEILISEGRVEVDGVIVTKLGARVDPRTAVVRVDGTRIDIRDEYVYLALNKPKGVLSAMSDSRGRRNVGDLVGDRPHRLFHVGRLDADSEGLLLLTNDGELAHRLMHPSFEIVKVYLATVQGRVGRDVGRRLRAGVELEDGPARVDRFRILDSTPDRTLVEVALHEGRKHIVRRLLAEVGHPVLRLVRTSIGPVRLGSQRAGEIRELTRTEVGELRDLVDKAI
jgi:23S rRNA pseudouridine2605 synthase